MRTSCSDETHRRGGRPRLDPALERKGFSHGWLVAVDAQTSKIVSLACMKRPENNAMVLEMLEKLVQKYPKLKTLIYDRACALVKQARKRKTLVRLRHYVVDKFHAYRHLKKCAASPLVHKSLARAISGFKHLCCGTDVRVAKALRDVVEQHVPRCTRILFACLLQNA